MSARDAILQALGGAPGVGASPAPPPLYTPDRSDAPSSDTDLVARFAASLEAASGSIRRLADSTALADALRTHPQLTTARRVWSSLRGFASRHPDGPPRIPRDLSDLDIALLRGTLGVAESGAVWLEPQDASERAALFLAAHVILLLPRAALVPDLHAAYARIDFTASSFGCFVCGPSKTADIEQALVIGAHGPKSLEVWLS
jgi:L-lactate dehydrogenase complex protein LldG